MVIPVRRSPHIDPSEKKNPRLSKIGRAERSGGIFEPFLCRSSAVRRYCDPPPRSLVRQPRGCQPCRRPGRPAAAPRCSSTRSAQNRRNYDLIGWDRCHEHQADLYSAANVLSEQIRCFAPNTSRRWLQIEPEGRRPGGVRSRRPE